MAEEPTPADPLAIDISGPIRRFADTKLQESVTRVLAMIPANKHAAIIAVASKDGARLAAAARIGGDFSIMGVLEKPWKGTLKAEAALVWTP